MENKGTFFKDVYRVVATIPYGKVMTYGQIALTIGKPRAAQAVGWALHQNPSQSTIPCHRVVNRMGRIAKSFAFGGEEAQKDLLIAEGIVFLTHDTMDIKAHIFNPTEI